MHVDDLKNRAVHPAAEVFPMMNDEALLKLAADIEKNGIIEPVVLFENLVLDGRNRLAAAIKAKVTDIPTRNYEGNDPLGYVLSLNLARRQLTTGQLAEVAVRVLGYEKEQAAARYAATVGRPSKDEKSPLNSEAIFEDKGEATAIAAKRVGIGKDSVQKMDFLMKKAESDSAAATALDKIRKGEFSLNQAVTSVKPKNEGTPTVDALLSKADRAYASFIDVIEDMRKINASFDDLRYVERQLDSLLQLVEKAIG